MAIEAPTADRPVVRPPRRRHRVARGCGLVIGWLATLAAASGLAAHFLDTRHQSLIVLASGAWALIPFSVLALGLHLWRRAWFAVVVATVLVAAQTLVYAPLFVADTAPVGGTAVQVLTQNLLYGHADPHEIVARVRAAHIDVFVAQELTATSVAGLREAGLDDLLPYSVLDPRPESPGTGLWSRYPVGDPQRFAARGLAGVTGLISLPGGASLRAVTFHPSAPFPQDPEDWYRDLDLIRTTLRGLPAGAAIVGADLNATYDSARFRRLVIDGWRDGAEQAGAGLVRTWPSNRDVPALVGIDHVLTRGAVATSVTTVPAPGSDHLGLLATVVVPR